MRGRPPKHIATLPPTEDLFTQLRLDAGTRTLGQLIQEREWAFHEIEQLRHQIELLRSQSSLPELSPHSTGAERSNGCGNSFIYSSTNAFLTGKQIRTNLGISNSTLYRWVAECGFPKPINLGGRAVRWRAMDVRSWIEASR